MQRLSANGLVQRVKEAPPHPALCISFTSSPLSLAQQGPGQGPPVALIPGSQDSRTGREGRAPGLQLQEALPQTPSTRRSPSTHKHMRPPGRGGKWVVRDSIATENPKEGRRGRSHRRQHGRWHTVLGVGAKLTWPEEFAGLLLFSH